VCPLSPIHSCTERERERERELYKSTHTHTHTHKHTWDVCMYVYTHMCMCVRAYVFLCVWAFFSNIVWEGGVPLLPGVCVCVYVCLYVYTGKGGVGRLPRTPPTLATPSFLFYLFLFLQGGAVFDGYPGLLPHLPRLLPPLNAKGQPLYRRCGTPACARLFYF